VTIADAIRWWMWMGIGALLIIAKTLPNALPRRSLGAVVVGALTLALVALIALVDLLGERPEIERVGTLDPLISRLADDYRPERTTVLIVGSSRSTLGLDGAALERQLTAGLKRDLQVLQFSAAGHYALEQSYTIRKLLDRIGPRMRPERLVVLVELGTEIDLGVPDIAAYTTRGIEFFDARALWLDYRLWAEARSGNADHPVYSVRALARAAAHTALHHLGIGLLLDVNDPLPREQAIGFAPAEQRPPHVTADAVAAALALPADSMQIPSDQPALVAISRGALAADLPRGATILFYFPPAASVTMRATAPGACVAVAHLGPCFHMTDAEIRARLPEPVWFDDGHLLHAGVPAFTRWLGEQLERQLR
jgi:hypothetical protein